MVLCAVQHGEVLINYLDNSRSWPFSKAICLRDDSWLPFILWQGFSYEEQLHLDGIWPYPETFYVSATQLTEVLPVGRGQGCCWASYPARDSAHDCPPEASSAQVALLFWEEGIGLHSLHSTVLREGPRTSSPGRKSTWTSLAVSWVALHSRAKSSHHWAFHEGRACLFTF
jgi:hypothetical protein